MAKQPKYVDVVTYLTIEPKFATGYYNTDDQDRPILESARVTSATTKRPDRKTRSGSFVTQMTLRVDAAVFLPLMPQAVINIGANDVEVIEVEAHDPGYPIPEPDEDEGEQ